MSELVPHPEGYPIKLVRDKTTDIIGDEGRLFYDHVGPAERLPWLRKKLVEEVAEYVAEPGFSELADIQAVLDGLAVAEGRSASYLHRRPEFDPRGGFLTGRMMRGHHPDFDGRADAARQPKGER